jgi:small nuclear ribonucleoprotein D1
MSNIRLVRFLQRLVGERVTLELKTGSIIEGSIVGVDIAMNTHLKKVRMTLKNEETVELAAISVRGNTIRYILLPDALNLDALLAEEVRRSEKQEEKKKVAQGPAVKKPTGGARGRGRGNGRMTRGRGR